MKSAFGWTAALLIFGVLLVGAAVPANPDTVVKPANTVRKSTPGIEAAQALTTITGVAISPLLGVSAVGVWKYFKTPSAKRSQLPWFAQPWFWVPGLLLVLAVMVKDILGTTLPTPLKKPFDVLEVFENKLSALIATGAFVPVIAALFHSVSADDSSSLHAMGLAMIDFSPFFNGLTVPFGMFIFLMVWLVSHGINVLILVSPFGLLDAALKVARLFVISALALTAFAHPYFGAALSGIIILICYFLAGWAFRTMVFGSIFAYDLFTMRQNRFRPDPAANWMFTSRRIETAPVRTYGKLSLDERGQLVLSYRPWLILPPCRLVLPAGNYAVGRGLLYPELLRVEGGYTRTVLDLPPRYRAHEQELAAIYKLPKVLDAGVVRGFKAVWRWLRELAGFGMRTRLEPDLRIPSVRENSASLHRDL